MKQPFNLDDLESFLSEQADQHRMYASDRVWHTIREQLHGRDRWPALTFASLLTTALIAVTLTIFYPDRALVSLPDHLANRTLAYTNDEQIRLGLIEKKEHGSPSSTIKLAPEPVLQALVPYHQHIQSNTNQALIARLSPERPEMEHPAVIEETMSDENGMPETGKPSGFEYNDIIVAANAGTAKDKNTIQGIVATGEAENEALSTLQVLNTTLPTPVLAGKDFSNQQNTLVQQAFFNTTMQQTASKKSVDKFVKPSRWSVQVYAAPSVSYRYLLEDGPKIDPSVPGPIAPYLTNSVNEFVRQQPLMGMEAGGVVMYDLADNFRVKTGLQLNYRQYGIDAYISNFQPATLATDRPRGSQPVQYTNISNIRGYQPVQLKNEFMQLSIPVGFDMKLADTRKVDFYAGAATQFTYQLSSNTYLLSSDFKNYLKQPNMERRFNMNAAIEAFASFDAGGVTWQAGPQIRYQLLPGNKDIYRIREHLIDYGFKIGVVKKLR